MYASLRLTNSSEFSTLDDTTKMEHDGVGLAMTQAYLKCHKSIILSDMRIYKGSIQSCSFLVRFHRHIAAVPHLNTKPTAPVSGKVGQPLNPLKVRQFFRNCKRRLGFHRSCLLIIFLNAVLTREEIGGMMIRGMMEMNAGRCEIQIDQQFS